MDALFKHSSIYTIHRGQVETDDTRYVGIRVMVEVTEW
jgi:hypothetical protein